MDDPLISFIENGREERNLEYKQTMNWADPLTKAKIVKSALAMANLRDGGRIVIGVARQKDDSYVMAGMQDSDYESFIEDHVAVEANNFADPFVHLTVVKKMLDGNRYVIIQVSEFEDLPIVCKRDGAERLRVGAIYCRPRRKIETVEIPSQVELREILDLAVEKKVRSLHLQIDRIGAQLIFPPNRDSVLYDEQLLSEGDSEPARMNLLGAIHEHGYWHVNLRPSIFQKARLSNTAHCQAAIYQASIATEGWHYPVLLEGTELEHGPDWIAAGASALVRIEYWRFYQSGQFDHHLALREDHMARFGLFHPQRFIPEPGKKYLAITDSVCVLTDIVEFAARLAYQGVFIPGVSVAIKLHGMAGRELTYMTPGRHLPKSYWFKDDVVHLERTWTTEELIGRSRKLATDLAAELFGLAEWAAPKQLLVEDQAQYVASRH